MKGKFQKFIISIVALAASFVIACPAFALNGADPEGSMPFAADSTGMGVSFAINNGDADENLEIKKDYQIPIR